MKIEQKTMKLKKKKIIFFFFFRKFNLLFPHGFFFFFLGFMVSFPSSFSFPKTKFEKKRKKV